MNLTVLVKGGFLIDQTAENILSPFTFQIVDQEPSHTFCGALWWSLLMAIVVAGGSGWLWWWLLELVVVLHDGLWWAGGDGLRWLERVLCGGLCWWFLSTRWRLSDSQNFPHLFSLSFTAMFSTIVKFLKPYLERINSFHFYKWLINIQKNLDRISKYQGGFMSHVS